MNVTPCPQCTDLHDVVVHYRSLVGALLEHVFLDDDSTQYAIADFIRSNDQAAALLKQIIDAQESYREQVLAQC